MINHAGSISTQYGTLYGFSGSRNPSGDGSAEIKGGAAVVPGVAAGAVRRVDTDNDGDIDGGQAALGVVGLGAAAAQWTYDPATGGAVTVASTNNSTPQTFALPPRPRFS